MGRGAGKTPRIPQVRPDPKCCPECGEEFVHSAQVCSDCGVPLRLASELAGGAAGGLASAADLVLIRAEGPAWIEALADRLRAEGVPSRVELVDPERASVKSGVSGTACGLFVREADAARAREIDALVQRDQIPDLPPEAVPGGHEGCPACGHALAPDHDECPDCGLFLG